MRRSLDLNCDLAEGTTPAEIARDVQLMALISSANLCSGAYAGSPQALQACVEAALCNGVALGAHPGYADPAAFGRRSQSLPPAQLGPLVEQQLNALATVVDRCGGSIRHIKLHGALYHRAAESLESATAICTAIRRFDPGLWVFAPPGSAMLAAATAEGLPVAGEIFLDRNYLADGKLVPRAQEDALVADPQVAARRLLEWLQTGTLPARGGMTVALSAATACLHSDHPHATEFARMVRETLQSQGVQLAPPGSEAVLS